MHKDRLPTIPAGMRLLIDLHGMPPFQGTLESVWWGQDFPNKTFSPWVTFENTWGERIAVPMTGIIQIRPASED